MSLDDLDDFEEGHCLFMIVKTLDQYKINAHENISTYLAIENLRKFKQTTLEDILRDPYYNFINVFNKTDFDELPPHKKWDHAIELIPDLNTFYMKLYPLSKTSKKSWIIF
jgi:hypothetical protein